MEPNQTKPSRVGTRPGVIFTFPLPNIFTHPPLFSPYLSSYLRVCHRPSHFNCPSPAGEDRRAPPAAPDPTFGASNIAPDPTTVQLSLPAVAAVAPTSSATFETASEKGWCVGVAFFLKESVLFNHICWEHDGSSSPSMV